MSGSYGTPDEPQPDPKRPVTSIDTAAAEAAAAVAQGARKTPEAAREDGDASSPADPAAHGGPDLRDLPSSATGVVDDDASKDHGVR
jgi:hypothetical protein